VDRRLTSGDTVFLDVLPDFLAALPGFIVIVVVPVINVAVAFFGLFGFDGLLAGSRWCFGLRLLLGSGNVRYRVSGIGCGYVDGLCACRGRVAENSIAFGVLAFINLRAGGMGQ